MDKQKTYPDIMDISQDEGTCIMKSKEVEDTVILGCNIPEHMKGTLYIINKTFEPKKGKLIQLIDTVDFAELDRIMYYDDASKQYNTAYDEVVKVLEKCQGVTK
jgi:hypothetical protein